MRVIPVIDLMGGRVVRGVAGRRSEYRPIESRLAADCRPASVARAFAEQFGFSTVYVADLDAIMAPAEQKNFSDCNYREIADQGLELMIDAGLGDVSMARRLLPLLNEHRVPATCIVGLESLSAPAALEQIGDVVGRQRLIVSLDLQGGTPLTPLASWRGSPPLEIAVHLMDAGISRLIVLDLADVGTASGTRTLQLCRQIRQKFAHIELIAGGGVRGIDDLRALAEAGCDAALVASALHNGQLTREELQRLG